MQMAGHAELQVGSRGAFLHPRALDMACWESTVRLRLDRLGGRQLRRAPMGGWASELRLWAMGSCAGFSLEGFLCVFLKSFCVTCREERLWTDAEFQAHAKARWLERPGSASCILTPVVHPRSVLACVNRALVRTAHSLPYPACPRHQQNWAASCSLGQQTALEEVPPGCGCSPTARAGSTVGFAQHFLLSAGTPTFPSTPEGNRGVWDSRDLKGGQRGSPETEGRSRVSRGHPWGPRLCQLAWLVGRKHLESLNHTLDLPTFVPRPCLPSALD